MPAKPQRPNILFFFSDQQRADTCGCYGQRDNITPNLDQMAHEGVQFKHAFSMQPVCGPARAALQTGLYPTQTGCYRNGIALPPDAKTLARGLSEGGYEVGYIGKWHLASNKNTGDPERPDVCYRQTPVPPQYRGDYKDYWLASDVLEFTSHGYGGHMFDSDMNQRDFPEGRYRADAQTDWVLEYLESRNQDRPFFLFASYIEPHHQNDRDCYEGPIGSKERFKDYDVPGDLVGTGGDWRENYPDYLGCVNSLDHNLGRIRGKLRELGMADNTIIIYTSDHGSHFCTRNSEYKRSCHEASLRIPMVVYGPGFEGGKVIDELVSLMDLPKTVLRMAGVEPWEEMQGHDLNELAQGTAKSWPEEVFYQISESHVGRGIRTKKWKYSVSAPDKEGFEDADSDVYVEAFLYDLEADPHERMNLVDDPTYQDVREHLADRLRARMIEAGEEEPLILSTDEADATASDEDAIWTDPVGVADGAVAAAHFVAHG